MASDLERGAYSGSETFLYYNSATFVAPVWVWIQRARNIQITDGPTLTDAEYHGAGSTGQIPGYSVYSGSFVYLRRKGVDPVYNFLVAARRGKNAICIRHANGDIAITGTSGHEAPILLGQTQTSADGNNPVTDTFPFGKADSYTAAGVAVEVADFII